MHRNLYNLSVAGISDRTVRRHIQEDFCVMSLNFALLSPGMAGVTAHDMSIFSLWLYSPRDRVVYCIENSPRMS